MNIPLPTPVRLNRLAQGHRTLERLCGIACEVAGVPPERLLSRTRARPAAELRFIIWHLARQITWLNSQDLAEVFQRGENNINRGLSRARDLLSQDAQMRQRLAQIRQLALAETPDA